MMRPVRSLPWMQWMMMGRFSACANTRSARAMGRIDCAASARAVVKELLSDAAHVTYRRWQHARATAELSDVLARQCCGQKKKGV